MRCGCASRTPAGAMTGPLSGSGADIGLRCHGCSRRVFLPRRELQKRVKLFLKRGPAYEAAMAAIEAHEASAAASGDEPTDSAAKIA